MPDTCIHAHAIYRRYKLADTGVLNFIMLHCQRVIFFLVLTIVNFSLRFKLVKESYDKIGIPYIPSKTRL